MTLCYNVRIYTHFQYSFEAGSHRQNSHAAKELGVPEHALPHGPIPALGLPVAVQIPEERRDTLRDHSGGRTSDAREQGEKS